MAFIADSVVNKLLFRIFDPYKSTKILASGTGTGTGAYFRYGTGYGTGVPVRYGVRYGGGRYGTGYGTGVHRRTLGESKIEHESG